MASANTARPAAAVTANGPRETDRRGGTISPVDKPQLSNGQLFVGYFGHFHSESILTAWSPAMLAVMRVHRVEGGAQ
jgi:hypothetical protein